MSNITKTLLAILLLLVSGHTAFSQETTSDIQGQITDGKTGIAGATITVINEPTGTKSVTTSRKDGRYNVANLRVGGPYTIIITYIGFKEEKQEGIFLVLGQDFTADFAMTNESKQLEAVAVTATRQNQVFNNSHTGSQEIISRTQMERLPTINRSISDFTKLEPTANGLSFSGTTASYNNITVDGADFNNSFGLSGTLGGQAFAQPIALDAIDQIQVSVSPYDVRQGGFTGAGVNSVTRSGTNKFKGSTYTYIKGPGTQGYSVENTTVPRTPFSYNIVGASIGGPIIKNKLFFFVNAEQDLQSAPATSITASNKRLGIAPVSNLISIADFDSLTILSNYLDSAYSYNPGAFQAYSFKTNSYKIDARIDLNINTNNTLTLKYNYLKSYADQFASTSRSGSGEVAGASPSSSALPFFGSGYRINNNLNIYQAELNTRFSNKGSNKIQVGYTRERDFRSAQSESNTFPLVDILFNNSVYTTFGYEPFTYNNQLYMDSYQLNDIFNFYKGAHDITIGSQNSYKKYQNAFAPDYNGSYQFSSLDAFLSGAPAAAYFQEYSTLPGGAFPFAYAGATNLSLFGQDKWEIKKNFTLTYGVRLDYTSYQNKFTDNPHFDALTFAHGAQYNVGSAPQSFLIISPRVGFNWDIKGDKTLQLRGGAGIFEGAPPFVWLENQAANNGVQLGSFTEKNVAFFPTAAEGLAHYLATGGPGGTPITQTATPISYAVNVTAKDFKYPTKLRTSIGLDKKFEGGWVITGELTYSKDINAPYLYNANLNETHGFNITNGTDTRMRFNTTPTAVSGTNASNKYYNGTSLDTPSIQNVMVLANTNQGWSYTQTIKIQKNFPHLSLSVAYTHSDAKTAMENGSTASTLWATRAVSFTDPNSPTLGRPSWYQPNRVIAYATYHIEYSKYFATSISGIFEAAPAGVTSYVYNGDLNGDGNAGNDLIYIPKNSSDINLVDVNSGPANSSNGTLDHSDKRTPLQIWNQLNNFISQDHYLATHRGHFAQSNSVVYPYYKHLDVNVTQDIYFYTKSGQEKDKHTLRISFDIVNVGNLLNKYWGIVKTTPLPLSNGSAQLLKFEGMAQDGKTPLFSFPYADASNQVPFVNSFSNNTNLTSSVNGAILSASRWQMQIGIRYLFN